MSKKMRTAGRNAEEEYRIKHAEFRGNDVQRMGLNILDALCRVEVVQNIAVYNLGISDYLSFYFNGILFLIFALSAFLGFFGLFELLKNFIFFLTDKAESLQF